MIAKECRSLNAELSSAELRKNMAGPEEVSQSTEHSKLFIPIKTE